MVLLPCIQIYKACLLVTKIQSILLEHKLQFSVNIIKLQTLMLHSQNLIKYGWAIRLHGKSAPFYHSIDPIVIAIRKLAAEISAILLVYPLHF